MLLLSVLVFSLGARERVQVNLLGKPDGYFEILRMQGFALEPTLPQPKIHDEPVYTKGNFNTVTWESEPVIFAMDSMNKKLLVFEVEAQLDSTLLWGFVDVGIDSATFRYLPEGMPIVYRLRYYARNLNGEYEISFWSNPVQSIQDFSLPILNSWLIQDMQRSAGYDWIVGQSTWARVTASDSIFGRVMQIAINEKSLCTDDTTFYDIEHPTVFVDTLIPYPILTPANELIEMSVWVVDVAGQISESQTQEFFWWPHTAEDQASVICYPNPFQPSAGEMSVIKVNRPGIKKGRVFDPFGNLIAVLNKSERDLFFEWDGRNQRGDIVSRGGYIFLVEADKDMVCKIAVY